jgi:hypothetical protein
LLEFTDPSNLEVTRPMPVTRPVEIGNDVDEFFTVMNRVLLDEFGIQYANARRKLVHGTFAEIRRDDDFIDRIEVRLVCGGR